MAPRRERIDGPEDVGEGGALARVEALRIEVRRGEELGAFRVHGDDAGSGQDGRAVGLIHPFERDRGVPGRGVGDLDEEVVEERQAVQREADDREQRQEGGGDRQALQG